VANSSIKPETFLGCKTVETKMKTKTYEIRENIVLKYNKKKEVITTRVYLFPFVD